MALGTYGRVSTSLDSPDSFQEEKAEGILFSRWEIIAAPDQPIVKTSSRLLCFLKNYL